MRPVQCCMPVFFVERNRWDVIFDLWLVTMVIISWLENVAFKFTIYRNFLFLSDFFFFFVILYEERKIYLYIRMCLISFILINVNNFYIIDIVNIFHFIWIKIKYLLFLLMIEHQIDNTFINRVKGKF